MAKKKTNLSIRVTDKEQIWGICYLLFSVFLLPSLIGSANDLLPTPLTGAWQNFLYFTLNFIFILWIFYGFFKRSLIHAGSHLGDFLITVIVGFAVHWLCNWSFSLLISYLFPDYVNLNDSSISSMTHSNFLIMLLGTVIFVPVAEEALHRGLVFGSLYPKSHAAAYILSTIIFSAVHIMGYVGSYSLPHLVLAFVQYIPAGLVLAWAYRKSGSILAPILMHATINAIGIFCLR